MKVTIGVSNRHVHLKKEHLEVLFGKNYELQVDHFVNQPGQFASKEKVTIESEKGKIENVRILGPVRTFTQVEISKTDAIRLGIDPPVRDSGDLKESSPIILIGPKGRLELESGCIIAARHIHITEKMKENFGFANVSSVSVKIKGEKGGILEHVHLKVTDQAYYEMHIDTDEANAFFLQNGDEVEVIFGDNHE